jgi:hypothetical protein
MTEKLLVDGHTNLYRDAKSGAIINGSTSEYENYMKMYHQRQIEKQKIHILEEEIKNLKSDISDIKTMLVQLVSSNE